ncbi:hypothetical protein Daudx_0404 [Candidatus Desulforudis audaxviator]|nr:hypothetical protein Daudx_0404 [Candidatus Desulforudis audaxviator]
MFIHFGGTDLLFSRAAWFGEVEDRRPECRASCHINSASYPIVLPHRTLVLFKPRGRIHMPAECARYGVRPRFRPGRSMHRRMIVSAWPKAVPRVRRAGTTTQISALNGPGAKFFDRHA